MCINGAFFCLFLLTWLSLPYSVELFSYLAVYLFTKLGHARSSKVGNTDGRGQSDGGRRYLGHAGGHLRAHLLSGIL